MTGAEVAELPRDRWVRNEPQLDSRTTGVLCHAKRRETIAIGEIAKDSCMVDRRARIPVGQDSMQATRPTKKQTRAEISRQKIIDACQTLILQKGFTAMSVNDICNSAGITKGGFFYHFASKDEAGKAAMDQWTDMGESMMCSAPGDTAVQRLFNCIELMVEVALSIRPQPGCVVGDGVAGVRACER